ncbi:MAG: DUF4270 domain-containing protein [Bacteroidales bacterium]|nr:DUF4270 domain-containing protein [Bacteroidales bacterium]
MIKKSFLFPLCLLAAVLFAACEEKESSLGVELQDPSTLYNGTVDTAYGVAYTMFDDSLLTSGQSSALIGCYSDAAFGTSEAVLFSQVSTYNGSGVEFDQNCYIDSVVMSLFVSKIFDAGTNAKSFRNLHFEVYQTATSLMKDSSYYAFDDIAVTGKCFFDDVVRLEESDSMVVRMKLNSNFETYLRNKSYSTEQDLIDAIKGVRIRLINDGSPVMALVNLKSSATNITTYYRYVNGEDTISRTFDFAVGQDLPHFSQFKNNYTGALSVFNSNTGDSIDGGRYLYLSPMGGTNIKIYFDTFVENFHRQHPYAVIHQAELILPVADIAPASKPELIAAFKCYLDGYVVSIPDMYDTYTMSGYDGRYDAERGCYRMRITQHFQKILGSGMDLGTLLVISGRRSSPEYTVINGSNSALTSNNPIRVEFVYSE